jgi:amino acid transporter
MAGSLLRKKSLDGILGEIKSDGTEGLRKVLTVRDLTALGIAAVIGAGIFSTIGQAAYDGGPGVVVLFVITAIACGFTALCYAEFAGRAPVSGSAYTYAYLTFGEMIAWIIGWALILEYAIGNITLSISFSGYFNNLLEGFGVFLPRWMITDPLTARSVYNAAVAAREDTSTLAWTTAPFVGESRLIFNLPAALSVILVTVLAYIGIRESKRMANGMVALKLIILAVIVAVGFFHIDFANWSPFMPNGFSGVLRGVSAVFFAYIGFDAISTTAEECANPQRDLPRGMLYSLIICTVIYVVVTLVITGMVNYSEFMNIADPLAYVFDKIEMRKLGFFISAGAVIAALSVLLVFSIGQPRIWMSMSRDGLLPKVFARIHPKFKTPSFATLVTGSVAIPALFVEIGIVTDLTSIGTLFAFALVCGGILLLPREERVAGDRRFRVPYFNGRYFVPALFLLFVGGFRYRIQSVLGDLVHAPHQEILFLIFVLIAAGITYGSMRHKLSLIPVLGLLSCTYLMIEIPTQSWLVFFVWMALGLAIYFSYGYRNSHLTAAKKTAATK